MVSAKLVKMSHTPLFALMLLFSFVSFVISATLVTHYNDVGYPNQSYRDRIRVILAASIWDTIFSAFFLVGVLVAPENVLFGIFPHLIALIIGFIFILAGAASLSALTAKDSCGDVDWSRCGTVHGLVGVTWVQWIFLTGALVLVLFLTVRGSSGGMRRGVMSDV